MARKKAKKEKVKNLVDSIRVSDKIGFVNTVGDNVVQARGLSGAGYGEMVTFPGLNVDGFIFTLNKTSVDILILGDDRLIKSGATVLGLGVGLRIPVSKKLLGRVISPLGQLLDGGEPLPSFKYTANINSKAPGIITREKVHEPVFTGVKVIDSLVPIGRGQRELVIGDKGTGKSSVCFDAVVSQRDENMKNSENPIYCIYVIIGQKNSSVRTMFNNLKRLGSSYHTVIVSATASDSAALQYLAPYSGCAIGEYFMSFAHALIIYDDLSQHAMAYRQIALLLRRPPGREAYPGDVFYLHSRLLERAAKLNKNYGGGSLTALPIVETLFGDVTAYIPTNVISITDGQIFLDKNLFTEGILPAINVGLSVSRVGSAAQLDAMKDITGSLKLELAQYREVKNFVKFGSDLDEQTLELINKGELLTKLLMQTRFKPVIPEEQIVMLYGGMNGYLSKFDNTELALFQTSIMKFVFKSYLFKPHMELLRFKKYYKTFKSSVLELIYNYFTFYYFKKIINN